MSERQVLLGSATGLVGADLSPVYAVVGRGELVAGVVSRFKKKEDIGSMAKSILKHKLQTLTGRNVKQLEEEMKYIPKDPNEPSMDIDTMRKLACAAILLSNGELESCSKVTQAEDPQPEPAPSLKRQLSDSSKNQTVNSRASKASRRSVASVEAAVPAPSPKVGGRAGRRSLAVAPSQDNTESNGIAGGRAGRRQSLAVGVAPKQGGRRQPTSFTNGEHKHDESSESLQISCSLGPESKAVARKEEQLHTLEEAMEAMDTEEGQGDITDQSSFTPQMMEMMKKRQSRKLSPVKKPTPTKSLVTKTPSKSPGKPPAPSRGSLLLAAAAAKRAPPSPARPPSPAPRPQFLFPDASSLFLTLGSPLSLSLPSLVSTLPLSPVFPGASLTVLHTPGDWTPHEVFSMASGIKKMNREAGLNTFSLLVGTGLENVHMNMEALKRHSSHVQFITLAREDANLNAADTGKLREITCFFLVAFFFPGCEAANSSLPSKMVRQGYTTAFTTKDARDLETQIVDCFSEAGEWVLDLHGGSRSLSVTACAMGRSAVALSPGEQDLESLAIKVKSGSLGALAKEARDKDGFVLKMK